MARDQPATARLCAASPRIGVIGRALPEIREHLTRTTRDQPLGDPAEERLLLQAELAAFVLEAVAGRKVAIFLDDAQRCDEGSAVALAACARARQGKLFLACAVRTDEVARAADAIDAIRSGAERVILAGLTEEATLSFVDAAFGEVPNVARFARSLHAASGGSPIQITEVLRDLVDSGAVRYEGGLWHLPDELGAAHSRSLAGAMDARVAALPPDLRELAVSLAVHGASVSIETCLAVAGLDEETSLERAQLLIAAGFLAFADGLYKIRHDGFKEALLRAMSSEEKGRVNLRVGRALEESGTSTTAQIGWHLLEGGEALRGAKLLEHSGRLAFDTQSFDDAIKMLEAALDVYEARSLHPKRCLELRQRIVACGMHSSKVAFDRHALRVIDVLERASGVQQARALERLLPAPLAFLLGFAWAWLRWVFGGARKVPDPVTALTGYFTAVTYQGTVCAVSADLEGAHSAAARLEIFAWMKGRVPHAAYLLVRSFYTCQTGEWNLTRADMERALETLTKDKITALRDVELRMAKGGAKFAVASLHAQDQQPLSLVWLEDLEGLSLRFFTFASPSTEPRSPRACARARDRDHQRAAPLSPGAHAESAPRGARAFLRPLRHRGVRADTAGLRCIRPGGPARAPREPPLVTATQAPKSDLHLAHSDGRGHRGLGRARIDHAVYSQEELREMVAPLAKREDFTYATYPIGRLGRGYYFTGGL